MNKLTPIEQKFVLHWGEMGTRWGINRTVAQIHALLYLAPRPLHAEAIATSLAVARSNVSTSLRELQGWGIVRLVHVLGDKRDHFEALKDAWEMFRLIANQRKRNEIDPTRTMLKSCLQESGGDSVSHARLQELSEFFETTATWYEQVSQWPPATVRRFLRLGDKAVRLIKSVGG